MPIGVQSFRYKVVSLQVVSLQVEVTLVKSICYSDVVLLQSCFATELNSRKMETFFFSFRM